MVATIQVNKQSIKQLLESGKDQTFLIPEYQRPYSWTETETKTLFYDLLEFTENEAKRNSEVEGTYFLGSIVSYENDESEQEIIDGQQRITSLFLLLRAIYTKLLSYEEKTVEQENFIRQIQPALWKQAKLTGEVDYTSVLITSKVIDNEGNKILQDILETGIADHKANDNYSKNYILFQRLFDKLSELSPTLMLEFIYYTLNRAVVFPIKTDSQDDALSVFSTLNDRGLPLSEADIFKAKMYNRIKKEYKKLFIKQWKNLSERAIYAKENVQQLFYYYMFYLRALEKDTATTTLGLRRFYSKGGFNRLYKSNLLKHLDKILDLWVVMNRRETIDDKPWTENIEIIKILDTLSSYPNESWKYPVVVFYLSHGEKEEFESYFLKFLRKLFLELTANYLVNPTVSAVKADILKLNVEIIDTVSPKVAFKNIPITVLQERVKTPNKNLVRMILKMVIYDNQDELLPEKWEVEYILPQKWSNRFTESVENKQAKTYINYIGNKIPFEKRLSIKATENFFEKKKKSYKKSKIKYVRELIPEEQTEWTFENIDARNKKVAEELVKLFITWNGEYKFK